METSWPLMDTSHVRNELGIILFAMTALNTKYPLIGACQLFLNVILQSNRLSRSSTNQSAKKTHLIEPIVLPLRITHVFAFRSTDFEHLNVCSS